jgi:hypothetical protein
MLNEINREIPCKSARRDVFVIRCNPRGRSKNDAADTNVWVAPYPEADRLSNISVTNDVSDEIVIHGGIGPKMEGKTTGTSLETYIINI